MKREREENDHKTSQSPLPHRKRSYCLEIINIPFDLTLEILKKLPTKSLMRFQCVSKQWSTIIGSSKDFIDSIVTRSLAKPRCDLHFIFHLCFDDEPFFFFSPTYYPHKERAVSVPREGQCGMLYQYVRGLICCSSIVAPHDLVMIYNPTTRQSVSLPEIESESHGRFFLFGYDPVMGQYKVVSVINTLEKHVCQVFTLGDPKKQWRNIKGFGNHSLTLFKGVHINGTIYYGAKTLSNNRKTCMSFDFRSERFSSIKAPEEVTDVCRHPTLVNYKGKLGCLCSSNGAEMWVMENAEKQEWSKTIFWLPDYTFQGLSCNRFSGVTLGGEIFIIQLMHVPNEPLYVYYYDPGPNSFRRIEIQGTTPRTECMLIRGVSDHVENTMRL